jgi:hypothetical protein
VTKDEAERSPSALLRAVSMSNGSWTFYEAVNFKNKREGRENIYEGFLFSKRQVVG